VTHLDHLTVFVRDHRKSARWYIENLGFELEFETPDGETTAVHDDRDFTVFLTNDDLLVDVLPMRAAEHSTQPSGE
jgi:hypothetical protein